MPEQMDDTNSLETVYRPALQCVCYLRTKMQLDEFSGFLGVLLEVSGDQIAREFGS